MRADYVERFQHDWAGGFKRLLTDRGLQRPFRDRSRLRAGDESLLAELGLLEERLARLAGHSWPFRATRHREERGKGDAGLGERV